MIKALVEVHIMRLSPAHLGGKEAREPDDLPPLVLRPSTCPMTSPLPYQRLGDLLRVIVLNRTDYHPAPPLPLARRG